VVPYDHRSSGVWSGLRIGTSALATRGSRSVDFEDLGEIIAAALSPAFPSWKAILASRVSDIVARHPLYTYLDNGHR